MFSVLYKTTKAFRNSHPFACLFFTVLALFIFFWAYKNISNFIKYQKFKEQPFKLKVSFQIVIFIIFFLTNAWAIYSLFTDDSKPDVVEYAFSFQGLIFFIPLILYFVCSQLIFQKLFKAKRIEFSKK